MIFCGLLFIIAGYIAFSANVIQYGIDQIHDAPTDDSVLYIHWFAWTTYFAALLMNMSMSLPNHFLVLLNNSRI